MNQHMFYKIVLKINGRLDIRFNYSFIILLSLSTPNTILSYITKLPLVLPHSHSLNIEMVSWHHVYVNAFGSHEGSQNLLGISHNQSLKEQPTVDLDLVAMEMEKASAL